MPTLPHSPPPSIFPAIGGVRGSAQADLARQQAALARLFVDGALRSRAAADPASVSADLGVSVGELHDLAHQAADGIARFALSLKHKRLSAARRILPLSARCGGATFVTAFARYAATAVLRDGHDYLRDSCAFAMWLAAQPESHSALRGLLRYEATAARMRIGDRKFAAIALAFHPRALATWARNPGKEPPPRLSAVLVVWLRLFGGRVREWHFGLRG